MDRAQDRPLAFRIEDYNHVKLTNPYNWWVGTRYGEALLALSDCLVRLPGCGFQSGECRREEAQTPENDFFLDIFL